MILPLVSILIPVYNREQIISQTIESALGQTYGNLEVIISDNASSDSTWDVIQQYAARDDRIKAFRHERNVGPVRNWITCVEQASGEFSKFLWSDDLIHPEFIEKLLPYLESDSNVGFAYSSAKIFSGDNPMVGDQAYDQLATGVYDSSVFIDGSLFGNNFPVSPGCALFRTKDVRKNLLLQVPNRVQSDFSMHAIGNDLLLFLLTAHEYKRFAFCREHLSFFRAHPGSITVSSSSGKIHLHYDLAKGYFAEHVNLESRKRRVLNARFLIELRRCRADQYGIRSVADFYPSGYYGGVAWYYLMKLAVRKWIKLPKRILGRSASR